MTHTQSTLQTSDGQNLFYQSWHPEQTPHAVILFQHGFCEHGGKYEHIAHHFTQKGYLVCALDFRGHGQSSGKHIFIDRFEQHVNDFAHFAQHIQNQHPNWPYFVIAHSMGGTTALLWAAQHQPQIKGLILSGAALHITAQIPYWLSLISNMVSTLFPHMPTLSTNTPSTYSRDKELLKKWQNDPLLNHGRIPARTGTEILRGAQMARQMAPAITLPILILHGTKDTLIAPKGSQELHDKVSSEDKTLIFYDGLQHEILNEPERVNVLADIDHWLQQRQT